MKRGTILILSLLMTKLAICQNGYPKKVVIGPDTVVAITQDQMKIVNKVHISLQECREINDSLFSTIDSCKVLSYLHDSTTHNLQQQLFIKSQAIQERDSIIDRAIIRDKRQIQDIKRLERYNRVIGIFSGSLIILVGYLLIL